MRIPQQGNRSTTDLLVKHYTNKLDAFRTYSYYHVLGICSTRHLDNISPVFTDPVKFKQIFSQPTPKDDFGYRIPMQVDGKQDLPNTYFVLCNGMTDVDLVVTSIATELTVAMPKIQIGAKSLVALSGSIVITEPAGVKMLNMYRKISDTLNTHASELQLIIKTVFVGQRYDDTTEWLVDAPPIYGIIDNFQIAVDEKGSMYTLAFTNMVGGVGLDPNLTSSSNGQLIRGDGSIKVALESLAKSYTEDASNNFKRLSPEVAKGKQPIEYEIVIHPDIKDQIGSWTTTQQRNARQATANQGQPMMVPTNVSFDGAIEFMFEACADYLQQLVSNSEKAFMYKVLSVKSDTPTSSKSIYIITPLYINKYNEIHNRIRKADDPTLEFKSTDNVVIYDYIFTGKNTDITSFSMQVDEGMGYFQTLMEVNTISDEAGQGNNYKTGSTPSPAAAAAPDGAPNQGKYGTVGPGTSSSEQQFASQGLTALKEQYNVAVDMTWSRGAAKQVCILQTRGHTGWLDLFAINPHTLANDGSSLALDTIPAVYINIMMPKMDTSQQTARDTPMEFERFWYKGLWHVLSVKNTFMDGVFSTELEMIILQPDPIKSVELVKTVTGTPANPVKQTPEANVPATGETNQPTAQSTQSSSPTPPPKPFVKNSDNGKFSISSVTNDTQLTKDFKLGNLTATKVAVASNKPSSQEVLDNLVNLAEVLQFIKDQLNIPITVNSAYRSEAVNRAVGGASTSDHKFGMAVDFTSTAKTPKQIVDSIIQMKIPYKQLILEIPTRPDGTAIGRGWVHFSVSRTQSLNKKSTLIWKGAKNNNKYLTYTGVA